MSSCSRSHSSFEQAYQPVFHAPVALAESSADAVSDCTLNFSAIGRPVADCLSLQAANSATFLPTSGGHLIAFGGQE
eukprot:3495794-Prymnesium_polylepis.1